MAGLESCEARQREAGWCPGPGVFATCNVNILPTTETAIFRIVY
jgi:hypothetical protein